jgi:hypothetical protein
MKIRNSIGRTEEKETEKHYKMQKKKKERKFVAVAVRDRSSLGPNK